MGARPVVRETGRVECPHESWQLTGGVADRQVEDGPVQPADPVQLQGYAEPVVVYRVASPH